jgi:arginine repressor
LQNEDYIHTLIKARPSIYLDEIQEELLAKHGVHASLTTISQTLTQMRCSKKSLSQRAMECNEELRTLWELEVAELDDSNLFVFIDESAVDNRHWAWRPRILKSMIPPQDP